MSTESLKRDGRKAAHYNATQGSPRIREFGDWRVSITTKDGVQLNIITNIEVQDIPRLQKDLARARLFAEGAQEWFDDNSKD